jgi:4-diphosphocytidyl-2-C-methyl-D-erythritol kinase
MIETDDALRDCFAPAKLNLFLHIVGRRPDGYHDLQTVFQLLDWGDYVHLRRRDDGVITRVRPLEGVSDDVDLTVRAARLLQAHTGCRHGVEIEVDKRLPMGAGIGGGSSDAATTLLALNRLWKLDLPRLELQALALRLGADVPFFVFGQNAFAQGVGDALQAVELPPRTFLVVTPPVHVSTVEIFQSEGLTRDTRPIKIADFLGQQKFAVQSPPAAESARENSDWNAADWKATEATGNAGRASENGSAAWPDNFGRNDMQPVVVRKYAEVARVLDRLSAIAPARMTGSGASVFAAFPDREAAERAQASLPVEWKSSVADSVERHPLVSFAS